jgi:hypothetical protein
MKTNTYVLNIIEISEINVHFYIQLILNKRAKNMHWRKGRLLNRWCWESWICRRLKPDHCLSPCIEIKLKWTKALYIKPETNRKKKHSVNIARH